MFPKLIQKIRKEREEEKLAEKSMYVALVGGIVTAGFGTYFYLNRIKEFISILFINDSKLIYQAV